MNDRRYAGEVARLRSPQRLALLEVNRVVDLCLEGITPVNMLDVGMGSGIFAEAFAKLGLQVAGVDITPEMLDAAREFVPQGDFREGAMESLPFPDASFDLVYLGHVLHEADDMQAALQEAKRVARQRVVVLEWSPNGTLEMGPPAHHRLQPDDVITLAQHVGFSKIGSLPTTHMMLYRFGI